MKTQIRMLFVSSTFVTLALGVGCVPEGEAPVGGGGDVFAEGGGAPDEESVGEASAAVSLPGGSVALPERGASTTTISCPTNSVAVGVFGRASGIVHRIGLVCAGLATNGTLGARFKTISVGTDNGFNSSAGTSFSAECPSGQGALGVYGAAGRYLDRVGVICGAPLFTSVAGVSLDAGGAGGQAFFDQCPAQSVVKHLTILADQAVDSIQPHCAFVQP
jgi:hypothetical protein